MALTRCSCYVLPTMKRRTPRRKFGAQQKDRIFLAVLPDAETAARIHALAETLKAENKFEGTLIRPEHLHITLFHLGDWNSLPADIVARGGAAAAEVAMAPFEIRCPRAESFRNSTGVYPFVLLPEPAPLGPLHTALGAALTRQGLGGATHGDFKPHVTLLRDTTRVKPKAVEPIVWTVREIVLVHSLLGKTTHNHLGRWELR